MNGSHGRRKSQITQQDQSLSTKQLESKSTNKNKCLHSDLVMWSLQDRISENPEMENRKGCKGSLDGEKGREK